MRALSLPGVHRLAPAVPVILRVVLGIVMTAHGWSKLTQMGAANFGNGMLGGLGIPAPELMGYVVIFAELIGGVLLLVGLLTRVTAAVHIVILSVALVLVKLDLGIIAAADAPLPGAELDLALIAGLIGVLILGPGRPSIDHAVGIEAATPVLVPAHAA